VESKGRLPQKDGKVYKKRWQTKARPEHLAAEENLLKRW